MESLSPSCPDADAEFIDIRHGFEAAGQRFLIPKEISSELSGITAICAIPDTPRCFPGFINHRGETIPVFSLERVLLPESDGGGCWILLIDRGSKAVGILLDSCPRSLKGSGDSATTPGPAAVGEGSEAVPGLLLRQFCAEQLHYDGEWWWEFDHRRFCEYVRRMFSGPSTNGT